MNKQLAIAIDGPAGAGKSTVARLIAKKLGIIYIDTGAMYRAVALGIIRKGFDTADKQKVAEVINEIDISIKITNSEQAIFLGDEDVSHLIRTPEISTGSSNVALVPEVRKRMVEIQREIAGNNSVVMDGRDIGTRVIPQADVKIFFTASIEERAKRRYNELCEKGNKSVTLKEVEEDIRCRDFNDSTRECDPLKKAEDAIVLDTTGKTIDEVVEIILLEVEKIYNNR